MLRLVAFFVILINSAPALATPDCFPEPVLPDLLFPVVEIETSKGTITVELNRNRAPATVNNFLRYVEEGHYDNTLFHRVMAGFVVQGGGYTPEFEERPVHEPIINESGNGLQNNKGTIAMARFNDPHTATSQFYFNMNNNDSLNPNARSWGYAVFGDVIGGMEVLEAIAAVATDYSAGLDAPDVPVTPVLLIKARVQK